ncbi:carbohydrate ABC transporter permease [Paenibacillus sp. URB8-2]|uniref:carbohydrate ABC transporter permease n=1 Tax=Paenibacillus sp. URB8-2 TaxID=2741301 RepID=UPI0015C2540B|nr:sugar ABC transporter permease [Paenibacillus sp. URB8-2]BCG58298.1 glycerol-3-phosphate ABC transporter permease [Paenibacillus sp. URB8-2]
MEKAMAGAINQRAVSGTKAKRNRTALWCWLFVAPNLIFYLLFQGWPIVINWYYSMLDWSGISSNATFVKLDNYTRLIADPYFWKAYRNSFMFMLQAVPPLLVLSLVLAVMLNNPLLRFAKLYRTLFFIPVIATTSIVGMIMIFIWGADGPLNYALAKLNLPGSGVNWLSDGRTAMYAVIVTYIWKNLGMNMIYWLAGLQSIPRELYEAARSDGAGHFRTFYHITLPLIMPIALVILLLNTAGALKVFDLIKTMTDGGPFFATDVVSTYIYRYAFSSEMGVPSMGYASAAGIFFAFTIVILAVLQGLIRKAMLRTWGGDNS